MKTEPLFLPQEISSQIKQVTRQNKYHATPHNVILEADKEPRRSNRTRLHFICSIPLQLLISFFTSKFFPPSQHTLSIQSRILAAFCKHCSPFRAFLQSIRPVASGQGDGQHLYHAEQFSWLGLQLCYDFSITLPGVTGQHMECVEIRHLPGQDVCYAIILFK